MSARIALPNAIACWESEAPPEPSPDVASAAPAKNSEAAPSAASMVGAVSLVVHETRPGVLCVPSAVRTNTTEQATLSAASARQTRAQVRFRQTTPRPDYCASISLAASRIEQRPWEELESSGISDVAT